MIGRMKTAIGRDAVDAAGPQRRRSRSVACGEDGAVMVEFALMAPFLVLLVFGIVEYGSVLRNDTTITGSVRNAARVGAQYRDGAQGDRQALTSLNSSITSAQRITINRVVVYRASSADGAPTTNCATSITVTPTGTSPRGSLTDACNIYSAAQVAAATSGGQWSTATSTCSNSPTNWDGFWCPANRKAALTGSDSPPDYLGLYVSVTYTPISGIVPVPTTYTDFAVNRIEPNV